MVLFSLNVRHVLHAHAFLQWQLSVSNEALKPNRLEGPPWFDLLHFNFIIAFGQSTVQVVLVQLSKRFPIQFNTQSWSTWYGN
jgi:hypothetical protein